MSLKELLLHWVSRPRHPSFPTCIGHCQAALPRCTSMSGLPSAAREASYALSRSKKLDARGSTHHTAVPTSAMRSAHALLTALQECSSVELDRSTFDTLLSARDICGRPQDRNVLAVDRHWEWTTLWFRGQIIDREAICVGSN